jgi:hypothetical protein
MIYLQEDLLKWAQNMMFEEIKHPMKKRHSKIRKSEHLISCMKAKQ